VDLLFDGSKQWERIEQKLFNEKRYLEPVLVSSAILSTHLGSIENNLRKVKLKRNYQKFIVMAWSFHIGYTANVIGGAFYFLLSSLRQDETQNCLV
jgi:hypothetical protein